MISPTRHILLENSPMYYPFGNTRVRDVLEDYNNHLDDNENDINITKILFLGSGDLRNALQATTNSRQKRRYLHIHVNDYNESVVARNVMLLSIISAPEFNPEDENDFAFLWDLWYNSEWPETTKQRFKMLLKDLLDGNKLPENIVIAKSKQMQILRETWKSWQATTSRSLIKDSDLLMKKIGKERMEFILKGWNHQNKKEFTISQVLDEIAESLVGTIGSHDILHDFSLKQKISAEARLFMEKGNCGLQKSKAVCVNPTLLHPTTLRWHVHFSLSPYCGYMPLSREELDVTVRSQVLIRSCQSILKSLVSSYRRRLKNVKVFFYVEEALEYCYTEQSIKFDVIDCSNIADRVGLVNLVNACKLRLADHADAQIFTETMAWGYMNPFSYIEEMLCCPSSMIPTMYGLKLANYIQTGGPSAEPGELLIINLCFKNVAPFKNVTLYSSQTLTNCFKQLASKCFLMQDPNSLTNFSTLQTFHYVTSSCAGRITGCNSWLKDVTCQTLGSKLPSIFYLSNRTVEKWADGHSIVKLTTNVKFDDPIRGFGSKFLNLMQSQCMAIPVLRLVLVPLDYLYSGKLLMTINDLLGKIIALNSGVHFIDSLQFEMKKTSNDSIESATISFLLIPDHGLEETHFGVVIDLVSGLPIYFVDSVGCFQVEKFPLPYPFERKKSSILPLSTGEESEALVADSCVETENGYTIKVRILSSCKDPVSGLNVGTNQQTSSESAHELTLSINQPKDIKPLKISLPFPFIVDSVKATLHRQDRLAVLVLQKALGSEPWPCNFHRKEHSFRVNPLHFKGKVEVCETDKRHVGSVEGCCAACVKTSPNLKRCSRCRIIYYCSVECQRAHWAQHKLTCAPLEKK